MESFMQFAPSLRTSCSATAAHLRKRIMLCRPRAESERSLPNQLAIFSVISCTQVMLP